MDQVWIPRIGGPEVLELRSAPDPEPGAGEVRVRVAAAGVNFADLMARMGLYPDAPPLPAVVGYEVSGVVDAVGPGVAESARPVRVGDRVIAMCRFGGYSSAVVIAADQVAPIPAGKDLLEAAAIPVTGLTCWMMLEVMGRVREGDRVLVHSAGGGVGLTALDLLRHRGAIAVGTASAGKHEELRALGYQEVVDPRAGDYAVALGGGPGFDLILDPIGGESWAKGLQLLRAGGRLVCYGMSSNATGSTRSVFSVLGNMAAVPWLKVNPIALMNGNKGVMGVNMGHMWHEAERIGGWLKELMALWEQGALRPRVDATFAFADAAQAHQRLHDRKNFGKVLLLPADAPGAAAGG